MIISFSIRNFGSIKDKQTLSFEADKSSHLEDYYVISTNGMRLLKLALIYGANASGKTTVLKALDFLRNLVLTPKVQKTDEMDFEPFLFDSETPHLPSILSIDFLQNDVRYSYEVEFTKKVVLREELYFFKPKKANVFIRTTNVEKQFSSITFGSKIKINKTFGRTLEANTLWNNTVLGGFLKTNVELHELQEVVRWFVKYLRSVVMTNTMLEHYVTSRIEENQITKDDIITMLQRADFNISNLFVKSKNNPEMSEKIIKVFKALDMADEEIAKLDKAPFKEIEVEHSVGGQKYLLPISLESQGTQRYYGFAGLVSTLIRGASAMPIDELDSSLHPDLFNHFLLTFLVNAKSSQLIATTHNREVLNNKDIFRNDAIWFTNKNESCATELYSLADFDSSVVRDTTNIYNAYKVGKLGGVPNLGDYYIDFEHEN